VSVVGILHAAYVPKGNFYIFLEKVTKAVKADGARKGALR